MAKVARFPRGYTAILGPVDLTEDIDTDDALIQPFDAEIDTLYRLALSNAVNMDGWSFRDPVISAASRVFGNFRQWLALQAGGNEYIYDLNWQFIVDTVQFIREGHRNVSVLTAKELLLEHPPIRHGVATPRRLAELSLLDPAEFDNFIGKWCAQENGFMDMLLTLNVLFGTSKSPLAPSKPKL